MNRLNLGDFITRLHEIPRDRQVYFDFGGLVPDSLGSYRGYYEDLALAYKPDGFVYVFDLLKMMTWAMGQAFTGYKGGRYYMHDRTRLWVANWGRCSDTAILGIDDLGSNAIIRTGYDP